jgi:hypothetical protein
MFLLIQVTTKIMTVLLHQGKGRKANLLQCHQMERIKRQIILLRDELARRQTLKIQIIHQPNH